MVEVDIRKFFDTPDHKHLREFVQRRMGEGVVLRRIGKWLNAGVMEDGLLTPPTEGRPQDGVISPLLANIDLHDVLEEWFETAVKPHRKGAATLIRDADDFVIACTHECDARAWSTLLPTRLAEYGLTVHETKSRWVRLTRPRPGPPAPETFELLGFTWYWGQTPTKFWTAKTKTVKTKTVKTKTAKTKTVKTKTVKTKTVKTKTAKTKTKTAGSRLSRALTRIADWCRRHRPDSMAEQAAKLKPKLQGHEADYGRPGNDDSLSPFYRGVQRSWHPWLSRRSWTAYLTWSAFQTILTRHPLPTPPLRVSLAGPS